MCVFVALCLIIASLLPFSWSHSRLPSLSLSLSLSLFLYVSLSLSLFSRVASLPLAATIPPSSSSSLRLHSSQGFLLARLTALSGPGLERRSASQPALAFALHSAPPFFFGRRACGHAPARAALASSCRSSSLSDNQSYRPIDKLNDRNRPGWAERRACTGAAVANLANKNRSMRSDVTAYRSSVRSRRSAALNSLILSTLTNCGAMVCSVAPQAWANVPRPAESRRSCRSQNRIFLTFRLSRTIIRFGT